MTISFTVDELISRVRRDAQLASQNLKLTDAELVQIADEEIQDSLWPMLRGVAEDYDVESLDVTATYIASASDPLSLSGTVRLPPYVSSATISDVFLVRANGDKTELPRLELASVHGFNGTTSTDPSGYVLRGDTIVLVPAITQSATLRIYFESRPSRLVLTTATGVVPFTLGGSPNIIVPSTAAVPVNASRYDVIAAQPPLGIVARYLSANVAAGPVYTLYSASAADLLTSGFGLASTPVLGALTGNVAGYLCTPGETCAFPLPDAWWNVAIAQTAMKACLVVGDTEAAGAFKGEAEQKAQALVEHQANRVRKQPRILFNRKAILRINRAGYGGGWGL